MADFGQPAGGSLGFQPLTTPNPLQSVGQYVGIANAITQNRLMQEQLPLIQQQVANARLANSTGQQALGMNMLLSHAKILGTLANMPDSELAGGTALIANLDKERDAGVIDPQRYAVIRSQIDDITQNGGDKNGAAYRPLINRALLTGMSSAEAAGAVYGPQRDTTLPGGMTQVVQPPGILSPPGTQTRTIGQPFGGGMSPETGSELIYVDAPDGTRQGPYPRASIGELIRQGYKPSANQAAPAAVPAAAAPLDAGAAPLDAGAAPPPTTGAPGGAAPPTGTPGAAAPTTGLAAPAANIQFGAKLPNAGDLSANINTYNTDQALIPQHQQNIFALQKAHDALEVVATGGPASERAQQLRAAAINVYNTTGYAPPAGLNLRAAANDELEKYLTDYARQSALGAGTNLDQLLAGKSNASSSINPTAARDVINTNIGRERMAVLAAQSGNKSSYLQDRASFYTQHQNPQAFAVDMLTKEERQAVWDKMTADQKRAYTKSALAAGNGHQLTMGRQNLFKGGVTTNAAPSILPGGATPGATQ